MKVVENNITEVKDDTLRFLETVTYDELMAHTFLLDAELGQLSLGSDSFEMLRNGFIERYNVDDSRWPLYGKFSNWHILKIPSSDWRINYFHSLGKGYPEETLYEQFGELKDSGDTYRKLVINALTYSNRMTEIKNLQSAVNALYPIIFSDTDTIEVGSPDKEVAWSNDDSVSIRAIKTLLSKYLGENYIYHLTADIEDQIGAKTGEFVRIVSNELFEGIKKTTLVGAYGIVSLSKNRPFTSVK